MGGDAKPGDARKPGFPLTPEEIDAFAARSAALGDILRGDEAVRIEKAYGREDERAIDSQNRFFKVAGSLNRTVLATATIGAFILALGVLKPGDQGDANLAKTISWAVAGLGGLGILVGGFAAALLYKLKAGDLEGDWLRSRARAEQLRSEYFDRAIARAAKSTAATQAVAFDLVKTHLLDDQLDYFDWRGKRHETAAGRWLSLAAFATGVASVGIAAGGIVGAWSSLFLAVAALGAIGTAVVSFATSQETIGQERERAQRYRNNYDALDLLARQVEDVRDAIGNGSADALVTFTSTINQQLSLELGRFLEGGESIRASIAKLNKQIEKSREGRDPAANSPQPANQDPATNPTSP